MKDKTLQAIIKLKDQFTEPAKKVKKSVSGLGKAFKKNTKDLNKFQKDFGKGMNAMGTKAAITGGSIAATIGGVFASCSKDAMEFESAFTGVVKTLDTSDLSAKGAKKAIDDMRNGILQLSTKIPKSAEELSGLAEVAGQLGIKRENVLKFTETMARLADSTNIAGEEGALALAKFMNVMRTSQNDVDKLGSVIVELGNNMSTTEADILNMATRLSDLGIVAGFTEPQVLAWASAMSSVGIEAEMGGTAMKKLVTNIETSTIKGGEKLEQFAKLAGMSASQFKKAFKEDASKATLAFLKGLGNVKKNGGSISETLTNLGVKEVRLRETMIKLASASEDVEKALGMANDEWKTNQALLKESNTRYETTQSNIDLMKNQIQAAKIEIGNAFLPIIRDLTSWLGKLAMWFNNLNPETKKTIVHMLLVVGAIAAIIAIVGGVLIFFASLVTAVTVLSGVFGFLATVLGAVCAFLTSWIGIVVVVLGLLTIAWKKNFFGIRDITKKVVDNIKKFFSKIPEMFKRIKDNVVDFAKHIKDRWEDVISFISNPVSGMVNIAFGKTKGKSKGKDNKGHKKAFGLARVTKNEMPYRLHEGERVLTKGEAKRLDAQQLTSGVNITINGLTVREDADIDKIATKLVKKINQNRVLLGGV